MLHLQQNPLSTAQANGARMKTTDFCAGTPQQALMLPSSSAFTELNNRQVSA